MNWIALENALCHAALVLMISLPIVLVLNAFVSSAIDCASASSDELQRR